jgi:NitT/TauT family transport system ATP-binding protein
MAKLEVRQVSMVYSDGKNEFTALKDVSFRIEQGSFLSILGPSGCGKSTLLSLFAGLVRPTSGTILLDGEPIVDTGLDRSVVFQSYSLFPWMSAIRNVELAAGQAFPDKSRREIAELAAHYLDRVGLADFADKFPSELSGGMQQRVSIVRALAMDANLLLMDEPFGAVDTGTRTELQQLLLSLWESGGDKKTVIFVTHDIDEAIFLSDRILVMASNPGRIRKDLPLDFLRPRDRMTLGRDDRYRALRNNVVSLFYEDIAERIPEGEPTF